MTDIKEAAELLRALLADDHGMMAVIVKTYTLAVTMLPDENSVVIA